MSVSRSVVCMSATRTFTGCYIMRHITLCDANLRNFVQTITPLDGSLCGVLGSVSESAGNVCEHEICVFRNGGAACCRRCGMHCFSHLLTVFGAEKVSWFLMENLRCFVFFYCQDIKKPPSRGRRMVRNGAKQYVLPCETVCLAPSFNTSCRARQYFLQAHFDCFAAPERGFRGCVFCKLL